MKNGQGKITAKGKNWKGFQGTPLPSIDLFRSGPVPDSVSSCIYGSPRLNWVNYGPPEKISMILTTHFLRLLQKDSFLFTKERTERTVAKIRRAIDIVIHMSKDDIS